MDTIAAATWTNSKLLIKALIIAGLVLLLFIPTFYVQNLIQEREDRQKEAIAEVGQKWAGKQTLTGPELVLPFLESYTDRAKKTIVQKQYAYFLPGELTMNATILPQEKHRGIYKVLLYTSQIDMAGTFNEIPIEQLKIPADKILWKEAFLRIQLTDPKGLNDELKLRWNDTTLTFSPDNALSTDKSEGLVAPLSISGINDLKNIKFSSRIDISGSEELLFTPVGKTTSVTVNSKWPHPSFTGTILPNVTSISDSGFTANWKSLAHKRSFPQQFKYGLPADRDSLVSAASFGVDLFVPVSAYQKTMRSVKYAILCIALTFTAFFLIEMVNKVSVHPFQYGLIGLALVLFYTLLLSFSEYIGFNPAYVIASVCTIGLIGWFVKGILSSSRLSAMLSTVLVLLYCYVFTILQLQDYALLLGSMGLFLTLAVVMYFSRKVQW